jgi:hypothetical protein
MGRSRSMALFRGITGSVNGIQAMTLIKAEK